LLAVHDDGVGMPLATEIRPDRSLGMRLIRSLAAQLDGELEFRAGASGTDVNLTFEGKFS
jgi:two-component sensor histidine kinase